MKYDPKEIEQDALPEGVYDAVLVKVTETTAKKDGVNMEVAEFDVYGPKDTRRIKNFFKEGVSYHVKMYKLLATAIGNADDFEAKKFNAVNHIGANLCVKLVIQDDPKYGGQNQIADFLPKGAAKAAAAVRPSMAGADKPLSDDDIPF